MKEVSSVTGRAGIRAESFMRASKGFFRERDSQNVCVCLKGRWEDENMRNVRGAL